MTTLTPDTFPSFAPQAPAEGHSAYGVRAARYILTHGTASSWRLDCDALDAAADVLTSPHLVAPDVAPQALASYTAAQRSCRRLAATRRAELAARWQALCATIGDGDREAEAGADRAPAGPVAPAGGGSGGGGSKVPRVPKPKTPAPSTWAPIPALQLQADDAF